MTAALDDTFEAGPIIAGKRRRPAATRRASSPARTTGASASARCASPRRRRPTPPSIAPRARSTPGIGSGGASARAEILEAAAELFERDRARLMAVIVREAGKTLEGAQGDVREAVDYLRYYAAEARRLFAAPVALPGPTGERNTLTLHGRGAVRLHLALELSARDFHRAGGGGAGRRQYGARQARRADADHGLPGDAAAARGAACPATCCTAARAAAGSARRSSRTCASRASPSRAPTRRPGSSRGARRSPRGHRAVHRRDGRPQRHDRGFDRAARAGRARLRALGLRQRGPALLGGARAVSAGRLRRGNRSRCSSAPSRRSTSAIPFDYATDIGPVIDEEAQDRLEGHKMRMQREARELVDLMLPERAAQAATSRRRPTRSTASSVLEREVFGPILHVVRYQRGHLDKVDRRHQRLGLRPDARAAQPHRRRGRLRRRARARRQPLRQPQPDRRRRRACSRSAARGCRGPGPRRAGRIR